MKNSWDTSEPGSDARATATILFCDKLKGMPPNERSQYTLPNAAGVQAASDKAKRLFADLGQFVVQGDQNPDGVTTIPKDLMFRVYEDEPFSDRDDLVTIVLPRPDGETSLDPADHYRCTYWPYFTGDRRSPFARARLNERLAKAREEAAQRGI